MPLRINAQVQLLSLVAIRLDELAIEADASFGRMLVSSAYRTLAIMLTGQRLEITREPWNAASYQRVARLSAGEQFRLYMLVSTVAAGIESNDLCEYGCALGVFLQVLADVESEDPRFMTLDAYEKRSLWETFQADLMDAGSRCNIDSLSRDIDGLIARCQRLNLDF